MGGRGTDSKGIAFFVRQNALSWAKGQIGSTDYAKSAKLGDWGADAWKCNAFVIRAFNYNVIPKVIEQKPNPKTLGLTSVQYRAKDFYEGKVPGFVEVKDPQPGDICADGSHVGIVSGKGKTISASKDKVVENDWGFRKNAKKISKFFRYIGTEKKTSSGKK